jgi:hypothetical protein
MDNCLNSNSKGWCKTCLACDTKSTELVIFCTKITIQYLYNFALIKNPNL